MSDGWTVVPRQWDANTQKFLDFLGSAEGAGYNTIVGGKQFDSYDAHPNVVGVRTAEGPSTAAGKYQITGTTYRDVAPKLGITDFSPYSQDRIALELIKRNGALEDVQKGDYQAAIGKLGGTWASLPSSKYSQPKRSQGWVEKALDMVVPSAQAAESNGIPQDGWTKVEAPAKVAPSDLSQDGWTKVTAPKQEAPAQATPPGKVRDSSTGQLRDMTDMEKLIAGQDVKKQLTDEGMNSDPKWVSNAKLIYKQTSGKDFSGSDADAADWLKNYVAQTQWNLAGAGTTVYDALNKLDDSGKQALLSSLKSYSDAPTSLESVGRAAKGIFTDPTTYAGMGVGKVLQLLGKQGVNKGVELAIQQGLEKSLVKRLANSAVTKNAAVAGAGGAVNNLAEQGVQIAADGQEGIDLGQLGTHTAANAAGGAVVGKILNKLSGNEAVEKFARGAGDVNGVKVKAEVTKDLGKIAENPNMQGQPLQAIHANALEQKYVNEVQNNLKAMGRSDLEKMGVDPKALQEAVMNRKIITPDELAKIRGNPAGDALADAIEKAQRTRSMTQAVNASTNPLARAGRATLDWLPLPNPLRQAGQNIFGSRKTREQVMQGVLDNQSTANRISAALGKSEAKSDATKSASTLANLAKNAQTASTARQAVQQSTKDAAKSASEQLRIRNLQMGIRSNPKFIQGDIGGGTRGTLQYYGRLADSKELAKGLKIIEKTDPYLSPYIASIKQNKGVPNKDILLGLSDRLLKLRDDGILKPYIK